MEIKAELGQLLMIGVAGTYRLRAGERSGLDLNATARLPLG